MKSFEKLLRDFDGDQNMALVADIMQIYRDAKKRGIRMYFTLEADENGQIKTVNFKYA